MVDQDRDKHWRDLCQKAETEQDPEKLTALLAEIISALDDRNRKSAPSVQDRTDSRQTSFPRPSGIGWPEDQSCESALSL